MENQQPMPVFDQIQIFANHMGAQIIQKDGSDSGIIHGVFENVVIYQSGKDPNVKNPFPQVELHLLSIELKPLERISDEHAIKVCELYNTHLNLPGSTEVALKREKSRVSKELIKSILDSSDRMLNAFETLAIFDDLRNLGYALPYKNWTVEQLVEFGIYKLIEK